MEFRIEIQPSDSTSGHWKWISQQGTAALWRVGWEGAQSILTAADAKFSLCGVTISLLPARSSVLLAVRVVDHAVDVDLFAHVHCQDEREPAGAEVGAGLDPEGKTHTHTQESMSLFSVKTSSSVKDVVGNLEAPARCSGDLCTLSSSVHVTRRIWGFKLFKQLFLLHMQWLWKWDPSEGWEMQI